MEKVSERNERQKRFKEKAYVASFTLSLSFSCLRGLLVLVGLFLRRSKLIYRSSLPEVLCKKGVLRNFTNSQESTCARDSFLLKLPD